MKNIIAVFAFAITLFLGTQIGSAQQLSQDNSRPEVIAKVETGKLTESLSLNGDQSRAVFRALVTKEVGYQKSGDNNESKKKLDDQLKDAMKKTLNDEQYAKWLKTNN